jgi:DNA adenine methylase
MIVQEVRALPFEEPTRQIAAKPFVKWVGGKSQLLPAIANLAPVSFDRYLEPFVGGGAIAFRLGHRASRLLLNDANSELIATYRAVKFFRADLIQLLDEYRGNHNEDHYYRIRSQCIDGLSDVEIGARFIYLNRTCFNGLYRVNRKGQFNVPIGNIACPPLHDEANLLAASAILAKTNLYNMDYESFLRENARAGDFIYLDPPYIPISQYSDFKRYTKNQFKEQDHVKLAQLYTDLVEIGSYPILSNSCCDLTRQLYSKHFIHVVLASRAINKNGSDRGRIPEIIVTPRVRKWL